MESAIDESSQVFANPDGTFTREMSAAPVRARKDDGSWAPIDTILVRKADGSVRAKNTTADIAFSGGGTEAALVTLTDEGQELRLGWPTALPEPRLDGDTATYGRILPDVDLRVTAQSSGYTSVLVVKTAEAAWNPALAKIRMTVSGGGLDIVPTADGGFVARDGDGSPVFESPAGRMWDPAGDTPANGSASACVATQLVRTAAAGAAQAEGPGDGDAAAELPLKVTGTKTIGNINRKMAHPKTSGAERDLLVADLGRASRMLDFSEQFVPRG
ncbi:hypothetical protein NX794_29480 [Streptomyces sp. LP11]|uniref:Uncharacterized protein n=1 Tax=Streptomyces pyxinicus TaxID=2970331 RepID=A0ABT2B9X4_9ACTN|nr:hypothetical protein [Streptomyces sp. LP11]MCS0605309.1 hypothetical protein [Streptomyces sp. LP11]